ncbi:MAG: glycerate kinase [Rhodococcus sp. (in: high G+C Gram-positive bacteria)]|nr:glycerate kinase [Rhodococcus sp. (in: high G+C Gram-positive bacteria)]MDI6626234.1 glycerate kinase [Rhodococcus sp. (in: high G+C Gram-positive bacteria)]
MPSSTPLRFVVAPSGFKESLGADEVASAIAAGIRRVVPGAIVNSVPLVDGGEGSARALAGATLGKVIDTVVTGPVGKPVDSHFALLGTDGPVTAVVEMAAAAGLSLVPRDMRDPTVTTSRGVGELIRTALDYGAERILLGCGDSGTSDGGAGLLQALGVRLLDAEGLELGDGGGELTRLDHIDVSGLDSRLSPRSGVEIRVACNPHNILCGPGGVARIFAPQKGASSTQVEILSAAMDRWAEVLERDVSTRPAGLNLRTGPGTGASGGMGAGVAAVLRAELLPRFEVMLDHVDLDSLIATADLVLTAEGSIDKQTPKGKIPTEVARRAKLHGKPVVALAGTIGLDARANYDSGIDAFAGILPSPVELVEALERGAEFLTDATERAMRLLLVGATLGR